MSDIYYKIQNPATKLFSTGGANPCWNRVGKVWKRRGDLSSHFTNLSKAGLRQYQDVGAIVVEIETVVSNPVSVMDYMKEAADRAIARAESAKERKQRIKREADLRELERLQKLYPQGK